MTGSIAEAVLIAQVLASVGMFGVIWTIQLVHYPLMAHIPATAFVAYERRHTKAIALIVGPLMAIEGLCVLVVFFARPSGIPFWLSLIGGIAEAVAIGTTAFVSAPLHGRLENGFDAALLSRLILTNWIRTIAWTARGIIAVAMLVLFL
ncbi:MAG: hypothetical protein F2947_03420 [Actinobacteria bacterium]|uniref:Unannotated protein n=1 Tax=freshwater metagenome TaxID=449393 RepID=A0A6J6WNZ6_9ZZZZ|nr:hypothetical protein [Actinomycetota bacterium]MSX34620.1 hypothetical protein [Actinomycetota bacterium]MSY24724.1 hypothetical protein [Actinomycetota bacterium]MSY33747.1 hypothetical protein [Actinomycetota bacterium]MSZ51612.1 hypothetical protein [Actinomycetota bacterium]